MLGYTESDLNKMINAIGVAYEIIDGPAHIEKNLLKAQDFLQGLWAEGYFDYTN
jgi:hypothetical protein